jgi:hypothetical protein
MPPRAETSLTEDQLAERSLEVSDPMDFFRPLVPADPALIASEMRGLPSTEQLFGFSIPKTRVPVGAIGPKAEKSEASVSHLGEIEEKLEDVAESLGALVGDMATLKDTEAATQTLLTSVLDIIKATAGDVAAMKGSLRAISTTLTNMNNRIAALENREKTALIAERVAALPAAASASIHRDLTEITSRGTDSPRALVQVPAARQSKASKRSEAALSRVVYGPE